MKYIFSYSRTQPPKGFTLIELIMVIILLSVIGMLGGNFIAESFRGFTQSENRIEIYEEGKMALARMEREIHNAIPNAFNVPSATDLQFGMIDENEMRQCAAPDCVFGRYTTNNPKKFIRDQSLAVSQDTIISIYNLNWNDFTTTAVTQRLYWVNTVSATNKMNVENGTRDIVADSPNKRYYAVDEGVRYCLDGTTLRRDSESIDLNNYRDWYVPSSLSGACSGKPLATDISSLNFRYFPGSSSNSPLVTVDLTISRDGDTINFHKEIVIVNVP